MMLAHPCMVGESAFEIVYPVVPYPPTPNSTCTHCCIEMTMLRWSSVFLFTCWAGLVAADIPEHEIKQLPGWEGALPSRCAFESCHL